MDTGTEEVQQENRYDSNLAFERLVRDSLFFLIFVVVAGLSVRLLVWEYVDEFRVHHGEELRKELVATHKQNSFLAALQNYSAFKQESAIRLAHLSYQASANQLNQLLNQYFNHIQIQAKTEDRQTQDRIIHEILYIKAHANSLNDLYAFLDGMRKINAYIQIALPINITKQKQIFALEFRVHIEYQSGDL
ncbi:hypothetical protein ACFOPX_00735 [Helicobacter baculiformis]|uniref:Periplasmic protein n=1 Tax=Helicobacter baculiformis TaxID=427351 RepID=A0ABV7ZGV2_9HELI|nr:hypothetical protein [Helicobacter baculiformis]